MIARELDILARTVFGEARGETRLGRIAVAHVILNRAAQGGWWGDTVITVCLKPMQFSCWNDSDPNRVLLLEADFENAIYRECYEAALIAYNGNEADPTGGACHYHALHVSPAWAKDRPFITIGRHKFYKDIN